MKNIIKYRQFESSDGYVDFTSTDEFKKWFGDSKVVDEFGKPLPLYHGSPVGGISEFKTKKENDTDFVESSGLKEFGICFSSNIELAKMYKNNRKLNNSFVNKIKKEISELEIVLNNTRNSRDFNEVYSNILMLKKKLSGGIYQSYLKMTNPYIFDADGSDGYNGWRKLSIDIGYKTAYGIEAVEAISGNNSVYKSEYDGIIATNIIDIHIGSKDTNGFRHLSSNVYMVFSPSQIMIEKEI